MTIIATTPLSEGSKCYGSFTFSDGATVRSSGGLICSEHGRRHCRHHKLAHDAIIAKAASQEAAQASATSPARRCWECGAPLRSGQERYCDWDDGVMDFLKTNAFKPADPEPEPVGDIPLLMDVEGEVARVTAEMEAEGFTWSDEARTWVRKPAQPALTMAPRAAAALPADLVPETFSIFKGVAR